MSTWNTTSTNSRFGSTGVGPAIEGSSSTAWRSKQSPSIPFRTSPWSNVPREQRVRPQPVGAKTGNLSEVNNHLTGFSSDENNQPVAQTDKGDQKIFKPRIAKLMPAKQRLMAYCGRADPPVAPLGRFLV